MRGRIADVTHPRVLFVGPARDFSQRPYDGLVLRHQRLMRALTPEASVLGLALTAGDEELASVPRGLESLVRIELPASPGGRRIGRLARVAVGKPRTPQADWAAGLRSAARDLRPDAVVTLGPWLDEELSPVFSEWRCVHVFDEELSRMPEVAPQSRRARLLRAAELAVRRHRLPLPRTVVVIAEPEIGFARRRFGARTHVVVLPQTLSATEWKPYPDRSDGPRVLSVGNFAEPRNAEALAEVVTLLGKTVDRPAELRLVVVSGSGFHPALAAASAPEDWVSLVEGADDAIEYYRGSRIALVAAGRATGFKATILQAWLCGTPVVASTASARTVEVRNREAIAAAATPAGIIEALLSLWGDDAELERLAAAGRRAAQDDHDDDRAMAAWLELVLSSASQGSAP